MPPRRGRDADGATGACDDDDVAAATAAAAGGRGRRRGGYNSLSARRLVFFFIRGDCRVRWDGDTEVGDRKR